MMIGVRAGDRDEADLEVLLLERTASARTLRSRSRAGRTARSRRARSRRRPISGTRGARRPAGTSPASPPRRRRLRSACPRFRPRAHCSCDVALVIALRRVAAAIASGPVQPALRIERIVERGHRSSPANRDFATVVLSNNHAMAAGAASRSDAAAGFGAISAWGSGGALRECRDARQFVVDITNFRRNSACHGHRRDQPASAH